jgi:hypothetical protein
MKNQAIAINFLVSWAVLTYAVSLGDIVAMGLTLMGFLFMFHMCEDHNAS